MVKPVIFQITGFQNSRKTTLSQHLISHLAAEGLQICTIKHHGHGGKPEVSEGKDSAKHITAGATASIVEGEGRLILQAEKEIWDLESQLKILGCMECELILVEGHKHAKYPKAVLVRNSEDLELLTELSNIKIVFCHDEELARSLKVSYNFPVFSYDELEYGYSWILEYLKSQLETD